MQHLDDALIAEWVDGAIAAESPQYAAIASHVDQCDECRIRVDEERALAGHVRQLLGVAAPPERIPAFDEVLHRAGKRRRPGGLPPMWRRLAWAATIVVAGGVGWYGRGVLDRDTGSPRPAEVARAGGDAAEAPAPAMQEPVALERAEPQREEAATDRAAPSEARAVVPAAPPPVADAGAGRQQSKEGLAAAGAEAGAANRDAARRDAAPPPSAAVVGAVASPQPSALEAVAQPERMQKAAASIAWTPVSQAVAERVLGSPLRIVPDLPVTRIEVAPDGVTVRVLQDLGNGVVLDLVETAADARGAATALRLRTAEQERPGEIADVEATAVVDGIRVVATAPVSRDSLAGLLARVR